MKKRTAAEIIGFHLGWDMREVSDSRYQPTRYSSPSIYTAGDYYWAAPSSNAPPKNMKGQWSEVAEYYGRKIYRMHPTEADA